MSFFKPMDQGVINNFKCQYPHLLIWKQIADFENILLKAEVCDVMMSTSTWNEGTPKAIFNFWKHCDLVHYHDAREG